MVFVLGVRKIHGHIHPHHQHAKGLQEVKVRWVIID